MVDEWAACRTETETAPPINTFKNYYEEENASDSEDEQEVVFQDLQLFLDAIGEPQLVEQFIKHRVTLGQLLTFNEDDLLNCGIELVGDRKKILESTGQMLSEKWQPSSLHELTAKSLLSSPGIYISLNDINKHIEYIGVTFKYLKKSLERNPQLLELGKDYVGVAKISSELDDLLKTSKTTYAQLRMLTKEVSKHMDDPAKKPANHIDKEYIARAKMRRKLVPTLVVVVALCFSVKLTALLISWRSRV